MPEVLSWNFFNSTLFQSLVIIFAALFAFIIHNMQKTDTIRNAAIKISTQLIEIEENINFLKKHGATQNAINEADIFESQPIFLNNELRDNISIIMKYISHDDYKHLSGFYECAERISRLQKEIRDFSLRQLILKGENYINFSFSEGFSEVKNTDQSHDTSKDAVTCVREFANKIVIPTYLPFHYGAYLNIYLSNYYPISGTTTFATIKALTKKSFII